MTCQRNIGLACLAGLISSISLASGQSSTQPGTPMEERVTPALSSVAADPAAREPLKVLAYLVSGEWTMQSQSPTPMREVWRFGPGKHSLVAFTHGRDGEGELWREIKVLFWDAARGEVRMLWINPFSRTVMDGNVTMEGVHPVATLRAHQAGGLRSLQTRWTQEGENAHRVELLEDRGDGRYSNLATWDYTRAETMTPMEAAPPEVRTPQDRLAMLSVLVGSAGAGTDEIGGTGPARVRSWSANGDVEGAWAVSVGRQPRLDVAWIPFANVVHTRLVTPTTDGAGQALMDMYFYHHTGNNRVQCLALSQDGGVYQGVVTSTADGGFEVTLGDGGQGSEEQHIVRVSKGKKTSTMHMEVSLQEGLEDRVMLKGTLTSAEVR